MQTGSSVGRQAHSRNASGQGGRACGRPRARRRRMVRLVAGLIHRIVQNALPAQSGNARLLNRLQPQLLKAAPVRWRQTPTRYALLRYRQPCSPQVPAPHPPEPAAEAHFQTAQHIPLQCSIASSGAPRQCNASSQRQGRAVEEVGAVKAGGAARRAARHRQQPHACSCCLPVAAAVIGCSVIGCSAIGCSVKADSVIHEELQRKAWHNQTIRG